jgi:hypothetical protein
MASSPRHGGSRNGADRPKGTVPEGVRLFRTSQSSLARRYAEEALATLATERARVLAPAGDELREPV